MDPNKDGNVTKQELITLFKGMGKNVSEEQIDTMIQ